jgi:hypothetical protein
VEFPQWSKHVQYITVAQEEGKHKNGAGQDCPCRSFKVTGTGHGVGGVYTNTVKCNECHQEFEATETKLLDTLKQ